MWTREEVAPIPLSKNKSSACSRSPEAAALYMLSLFAFFFVCVSCSGKFKKKRCYSPSKYCSGCVIRYMLMKKVLVVSVFLEVTLKDCLHIVFPRGLSKLFLKISNDGDSGFPRQSTPVPDYSDD